MSALGNQRLIYTKAFADQIGFKAAIAHTVFAGLEAIGINTAADHYCSPFVYFSTAISCLS